MSCKVVVDEFDVVSHLERMGLPRNVMLEILHQVVGERANVTESDPVTTPGTETWRWGTRYCRDNLELRDLGWVSCSHDRVEGIRNDRLKIKLVVINTDSCTGMPSKLPRNNAGKGPAASRLVENNSMQTAFSFIGEEETKYPVDKYDFFYFCIHAGAKYVSAEISRPDKIISQTIRSFSDRILLCPPGEMDGLVVPDDVPEEFAEIDKPAVVRKK